MYIFNHCEYFLKYPYQMYEQMRATAAVVKQQKIKRNKITKIRIRHLHTVLSGTKAHTLR